MGIFAIIAAACWSPIIKRLRSQEQRTTSASSGTQDSKPAETKPQEKTTKEDDEAKKKAVKQGPKVEQHSQGENSPSVGTLQQGPCSAAVIGGSNNSASANCVPPSRIPSDKQMEDFKSILRDVSEPNVAITLLAAGSSDDVEPIRVKLSSALHELKWSYGTGGYIVGANRPPLAEGIECYSTVWTNPTTEAFLKAMKAAGLECKKIPRRYPLGGSGITVLLGRQPR
jgi:hypothetical protein